MERSQEETGVEYRDIPGFPGYRVGNDGSVWSNLSYRKDRYNVAFRSLKLTPNNNGHLFVYLHVNSTPNKRYVHRLVLEAFVGPCPERMECRHLDGNPKNNLLSNLKWGTAVENQADRILHDTTNRGPRNGMSKLTEKDIVEIRQKYAAGGVTQVALAKEYNTAGSNICCIVNKKYWSHIA